MKKSERPLETFLIETHGYLEEASVNGRCSDFFCDPNTLEIHQEVGNFDQEWAQFYMSYRRKTKMIHRYFLSHEGIEGEMITYEYD